MIVVLAQLSPVSLAIGLVGSVAMILIGFAVIYKLVIVRYELALQSVYFASYLAVLMAAGYIG